MLWCFPGNIVRPKGESSRLSLEYARGDKGRAEGHGAGECPRGGRVQGAAGQKGAGELQGAGSRGAGSRGADYNRRDDAGRGDEARDAVE